MKRSWQKILTVMAIITIVAAPMLLLWDADRFAPLVLVIWLVTALYYVISHRER
ncbi:MAG TPA: hypothetical protein PKK12_14360 [Candidatus Aminicenantes bacterium]|nr:hypothetical protein [Candidatus Aminicenantes bacterium]